MMLGDLRILLAACAHTARRAEYGLAIQENNVLGKPTASARLWAFKKLRELYTLQPEVLIFRALVELWDADEEAQPMLALLCAAARDPLLRSTAAVVLATAPEDVVAPGDLSAAVAEAFPSRYSETVLVGAGKNTATTWEQAGLLEGKGKKVRARATSRPTSTAYALLLGHLCGVRGASLFTTFWARLLDAPVHSLREQAIVASQQGWIEYRAAGDVVEVSFRHLLRDEAE